MVEGQDYTWSTENGTEAMATKSPPRRSSLSELPDEAQILILLELHSLKDLWSLAQTCKHFYRLYSTCDRVWCSRLLKDLYVDYARHPSAFLSQEHQSPRLIYSRLYPFKWARPGIWWGDNWQFGQLVVSTYRYHDQRFRWRYCDFFADDEAGHLRVIRRSLNSKADPDADPEAGPDPEDDSESDLESDLESDSESYSSQTQHQFEWINNHTLVKSRDPWPKIHVKKGIFHSGSYIFQLDTAGVDPRALDMREPPPYEDDHYSDLSDKVLSRVDQCHDQNHDNSLTWPPYCIPSSERTFSIHTQTDDADLPDEEEPQEPRHPPFSENLVRVNRKEFGYYTPSSDKAPYSGTFQGFHRKTLTLYRLDESLLYSTESQPYQGLWYCSHTDVPLVGSCALILQSAEHPEKLQAINVTAGAQVPRAETYFRVNDLNETRKRPNKYISWRDKDVVSCEIQVSGINYKAPRYIPGELVLADNNCLILVRPDSYFEDQDECKDLVDKVKCRLIFFKRINYDPTHKSARNRLRAVREAPLSLPN